MEFTVFVHQQLHMLNTGPIAMENKVHSRYKDTKCGMHLFRNLFIHFHKLQIYFFEVADNSSIQDLTCDAFAILGEHGGIRIADKHECSECTQEYKAVADWLPAANDAAAVLGVDENRVVPSLDHDVPRGATRNSPGPAEDDTMDVDGEKKVVKMVVMDSIVMGPTCCAFDGCEGALVNACGQGDSFCIAHTAEFNTAVVCVIVKMINLVILKLVNNTAMNGIDIHSHEPHQAWLGFVKC